MAKITINCGNCGDLKGCIHRVNFREFVETNYPANEKTSYTDDMQTFTLKCPFRTSKYKEGDKITVTIGIGRYKKEYKHECLMTEYEYSERDVCISCKFKDKCTDGEVTHLNTRYKQFIKIDAEIVGVYKNDKHVFKFDYNKIESSLNNTDKDFLKKIDGSLGHDIEDWESREVRSFYGISKNKFIELKNSDK